MGQTSTKAGVVVWGAAEHGQLGVGILANAEDRARPPQLVEALRSVDVRHVACSGHYSCAVAESGELYTWGYGKDGSLGHGDTKDALMPKAVRALQSKIVRSLSCAEHHIAAVTDSGVLYTWGNGQNGRLGHGGFAIEPLPKHVEALSGTHVAQVACGDFHTACITMNPTQVYTWGLGLSGRLGHGDETDQNLPVPVEALVGVPVAAMVCGGHHSAAILEPSGQLMTWGGGAFGKLGHGNRLAQTAPKLVAAFQQGKRIVQASLGPHHSAALTHKGEVYTWGQAGRLGHASHVEVDEMLPRQVMALANVFVLQVSCGHTHCAVVTETGDVWAWGATRACGHTEASAVPNMPTLIKVLSGKGIVQVACGVSHSVALSDYRRLSGKAAMAAVKSIGTAGANKDTSALGGPSAGRPPEHPTAESKKLMEAEGTLTLSLHSGDERSASMSLTDQRSDLPENYGQVAADQRTSKGLPLPSSEREVAYLSGELKMYQEQTLKLAKLLQETKTKLEGLQNENSFLKSELEVMHQCSNDADERLDTLRRHFTERIREMERRYSEKERVWKETFGRLRSHLELGVIDADAPNMGLGPDFAAGGAGGTRRTPVPIPNIGGPVRGDGTAAALPEGAQGISESLGMASLQEETAGTASGDSMTPGGLASDTRSEVLQAARGAAERARGTVGRVSLWPGGQA
mmetsp:Transcript_67455/g.161835  ORF Transcript_67455/g.161835 Transcript_67455/m.161835 type:complete len:689 (-) Transcript_67455:55-2121(-)